MSLHSSYVDSCVLWEKDVAVIKMTGLGNLGKPQSEAEMVVLSQFLDRRIWEVEGHQI